MPILVVLRPKYAGSVSHMKTICRTFNTRLSLSIVPVFVTITVQVGVIPTAFSFLSFFYFFEFILGVAVNYSQSYILLGCPVAVATQCR